MKWIDLPRIALGILFALILLSGNALAKQQYKVQRGDTLSSIAEKNAVTVTALKETNHLKNSKLNLKQTLIIPSAKAELETANLSPKRKAEFYSVKKGDTLSRIAAKTGVSAEELRRINNLSSTRIEIGQKIALDKENNTKKITEPSAGNLTDAQPSIENEKEDINLAALSDLPEKNEAVIGDNEKRELLGEWNTPDEQQLLVKVALAFLGAPYRLGGSSVQGIDCSGFVKKIYSLFGIDLPRTAAEQSHVGIEVAKSNLVEGDLIFFNNNNRIGHVGIYIGGNKFVHAASQNKGVRVDSLNSSYYKNHYKRAVRLKASDNAT
ncbi:MAG: NlpC/P60 family protein [Syntrophales bacterium]|jgi:cell wall-associated NlpC family hydrolase|nr:NlpC/P60 family protein [Syntrophales bacterium]